jgi:Antitoxin of toxin-antitoxin stability system
MLGRAPNANERRHADTLIPASGLDLDWLVIQIRITMKSTTVRELRNNFSQIAKWLRDGEQVVITMRKKVVGRIIPEPLADRPLKMPDFAARIAHEYPHPQISERESADLRRELRGER